MANHGTLAGSFLEDLDELEEENEEIVKSENEEDEDEDDYMDDLDDLEQNENDDDLDALLGKMAAVKGIHNIALLRASSKFNKHMEQVTSLLGKPTAPIVGPLEEDSEYKLLVQCNTIIREVDEEMNNIHRYVSGIYAKKFPELESLIPNKIDYIRTVQRIGNEMDMTLIELNDLLPSASVMVVSVTGSTTSGQPLSDEDLEECMKGCEELLALDQCKSIILTYVESRMTHIAPNLCAIIGSRVGAQIVGMAGGLVALSKIPACNLQVMGQEKHYLAGFSSMASMPNTGILYYCELIQSCAPYLRKKALKVTAGKVTLASRIDSYMNHPTGDEGLRLRRELEEKFEKWLEPPKARTKKALPIPEEKQRSKRGGKRVRRFKERFAMTEFRAQQNKMTFKDLNGEYGDSAMGQDLGMIGSGGDGAGKIRAVQKKEVHLAKKMKKAVSMSSGKTNGLSSSLVFTPVQGLELVNPNAAAERVREANKKWFDTNSGFLSAAPK
mmetsp:Transcript_27044/g.27284  ORF Transcript_27044/g.27284 Transcript_27044/m.27284 type:complete len:498 (-) Transcript_27044:31-1524(-)|eukprot:CAMPEP_0182421798 /NCGR_PEP_ID=MMETSP1167-20130531/7296_1 /TAXON_ID=2988 /ORGANISM="Mallomonas Sp, Strain CCMP3275" /LENGTH=497 /DNA_ID=CAMNT_0024599285 /DNA_START=48 /DNA_END=1538 /DNA_ORIENTATION=+